MGNWIRRNQSQRDVSQIIQDIAQQKTAIDIFRQSNQTAKDLIDLLASKQSEQQNHATFTTYIGTLKKRDKLQQCLWQLQKYLLQLKNQSSFNIWNSDVQQSTVYKSQLTEQTRKNIFQFVHKRYANLWFIVQSSSNSRSIVIHDKQLHQLHLNKNYKQKICLLYLNSLSLGSELVAQTWIRSALLSNNPLLITPQTIKHFFQKIIQEQVYLVDEQNHFLRFLTCLVQWGSQKHSNFKQQYTQRAISQLDGEQQEMKESIKHGLECENQIINQYSEKTNQIKRNINHIAHAMIEQGKVFLDIGNPYAMQLIFKSISKQAYYGLTEQEVQLYLYARVYSIFLYSLNYSINLDFFQQLYQMSITNIIHLLLMNNEIDKLQKLAGIYDEMEDLKPDPQNWQKNRKRFSLELQKYLFSNYCTFKLCIRILNETNYINFKQKVPDQQIISKIKSSKFQTLIENSEQVRQLIQKIKDQTNLKIDGHIFQKSMQIISIFYTLGINQKVSYIWQFFEVGIHAQTTKTVLQQKTFYLLKNLIAKYFISNFRGRSITLDESSYDLSKTQTLFHVCHYLYIKIFSKAVYKVSDIDQIIFQHMLYFYKYDELSKLLSNSQFMKRFGIDQTMFQLIIIQNILDSLKKTEVPKIQKDIKTQLKMLKSNTIQIQNVQAMFKLLSYLQNQMNIKLNAQDKEKIDMKFMYGLVDKYPQRLDALNFDQIYQQIKTINSDDIIDEQEQYQMTNQLLLFKSYLAVKAYQNGKKKLGNQLIDEINRFNPPWITTKLIQIFKQTQNKLKIDPKLYALSIKSCAKGQDLKYLLKLWKQRQVLKKKQLQNSQLKKFMVIGQYFETGRQYLVINDEIIKDDAKYTNFVAQSQFSDETLNSKQYELFFVLLASQNSRAFHFALTKRLQISKLDIFLRQGMKIGLLNSFVVAKLFHRLLYFAIFQQGSDKVSYSKFRDTDFNKKDINQMIKKITESKDTRKQIYARTAHAFLNTLIVPQKFFEKYIDIELEKITYCAEYEFLFNETKRIDMLISTKQKNMNLQDIVILGKICQQMNIKILDICLFSLTSNANTSVTLNQKMQLIIQKIAGLTITSEEKCMEVVKNLCNKIFSYKMLLLILEMLRQGGNQIFKIIIVEKKLDILKSLAMVEMNQQFSGLLPDSFLFNETFYNPVWPINPTHEKIIQKSRKKNNIFVLSKVLYFFYGMNPRVQKKILDDFLFESQDQQFNDLRQKLKNAQI